MTVTKSALGDISITNCPHCGGSHGHNEISIDVDGIPSVECPVRQGRIHFDAKYLPGADDQHSAIYALVRLYRAVSKFIEAEFAIRYDDSATIPNDLINASHRTFEMLEQRFIAARRILEPEKVEELRDTFRSIIEVSESEGVTNGRD